MSEAIGRIIYRQSVAMSDNSGIIKDKAEFKTEEYKVIGENEYFIVINDRRFSTISKKAEKYQASLGVQSIGLYASDTVWGNRIDYVLFTETPKRASTIKKEIEKAIDKKYGYFVKWANLDFITNKAANKEVVPCQ